MTIFGALIPGMVGFIVTFAASRRWGLGAIVYGIGASWLADSLMELLRRAVP